MSTSLAKKIAQACNTFKTKPGSKELPEFYFDKYQFMSNGQLLDTISREITKIISHKIQVIAGVELGGISIATAVSLKTYKPMVFIRKTLKTNNHDNKMIEGTDISGKNICIITDVITTGEQIFQSIEELKKRDATIIQVVCVVLKDKEIIKKFEEQGIELKYLFYKDEVIKSYS